MELTFTYKPEQKLYIAEFRADKEFNIHIERPEPGYISMQQNSAEGGKYAAVDDWGTQNNDKLIIDYESGYFVTPKFIKIISKVLPTYAAITTEGDVVEIKSQSKVVEITSNGTTSVEPDAGFSYMDRVTIKTNVPQSGEGGGLVFLSIPEDEQGSSEIMSAFIYGAVQARILVNNDLQIVPYTMLISYQNTPMQLDIKLLQVSVDPKMKIITNGSVMIAGDLLSEVIASYPHTTEEEFYNLES